MEKGYLNTKEKMVTLTMGSGQITKKMGKVFEFQLMVMFTKENGSRIRKMVMAQLR